MAVNTATDPSRFINFPCPSTVVSGMPVLVGTMAGVVQATQANSAGTVITCTVQFDGSHFLTVIGQSTQSPNSVQAIKPGDELFASGSYDATTNFTTGLTIDKTRGNTPFGNALAALAAGATNTLLQVRLKITGSGPYAP